MKNIELAESILSDYYGIVVPRSFLIEVIERDSELKYEVEIGGICDTEERSALVNAIIRELGVDVGENFIGMTGQWPCYGDSEKYRIAFYASVTEKIEKIGGTFER